MQLLKLCSPDSPDTDTLAEELNMMQQYCLPCVSQHAAGLTERKTKMIHIKKQQLQTLRNSRQPFVLQKPADLQIIVTFIKIKLFLLFLFLVICLICLICF